MHTCRSHGPSPLCVWCCCPCRVLPFTSFCSQHDIDKEQLDSCLSFLQADPLEPYVAVLPNVAATLDVRFHRSAGGPQSRRTRPGQLDAHPLPIQQAGSPWAWLDEGGCFRGRVSGRAVCVSLCVRCVLCVQHCARGAG